MSDVETTVVWLGVGRVNQRTSEGQTVITLSDHGIVGDRHEGPNRTAGAREAGSGIAIKGEQLSMNPRQITILSEADITVIKNNLQIPSLLPEDLGANIILADFPEFTRRAIGGTLLQFPGGSVILAVEPNQRCVWPGRAVEARLHLTGIAKNFRSQTEWLGGINAMVYRNLGPIHVGDTVNIYFPKA